MAAADTARLLASLDLNDSKFQAGIRRSLGSLGKLDKGMSGVGRNVGKIGKGFGKAAAIVGGAAVTGLVLAGKAAIDYQEAFQGVIKTVEASPAKFDEISDALRRMSTEMPISAIELAAIAEAGGAMGIKAKDIEAFTKQVAILATTTDVSADDAATALGQLQNVIGLTGSEFDNFAASLVDLGNKGASTESAILEIARRSGGAAKLFGIAKDQILGWSAAAANLGINSELAGTSLQNVFIKLLPKISKGSMDVNKVFGLTGKQVKKLFAKDASGALALFVRKLAKLPKEARLDKIQDIFGKGSGITRLLLGLTGDLDNVSDSLKTNRDAWFASSAAQEEFDKRNATVRSSLTRLKNGIIDAGVSIGEGFTPAIGRAADKLATFLKDPANRTKLQEIGKDIGKAIDSIDWDKLLGAAKSLASAFKPALDILLKVADIIAKLPPEVIGAGGAAILTDRLSGGAISSGLGGIIGGLGESLAKGLAAKIPLFGAAFVQPVFVTNMPVGGFGGGGVPGAGGKGGALGKGLRILGGVSIVLGVAEIASIVDPVVKGIAFDIHKNLNLPDIKPPIPQWWPFGPKGTPTILPEVFGGNGLLGGTPGDFTKGRFDPSTKPLALDPKAQHYLELIHQKEGESKAAFEGGMRAVDTSVKEKGAATQRAVGALDGTTRSGLATTTGAVNTAGSRIVGAIASNRPIVSTNVEVNVTSSGVQKATTTSTRYGQQNGSAGGGGNGSGPNVL